MIAPRHPQRFEEATAIARKAGFKVATRTSNQPGASDVLILDTIGELAGCYEISDFVFVGGTLSDYGGHNPIEPAFFHKPILAGPHDSNFRSIFQEFRERNAILITEDLTSAMHTLLGDHSRAAAMAAAAQELVRANTGATEIAMECVRRYLTDARAALQGV